MHAKVAWVANKLLGVIDSNSHRQSYQNQLISSSGLSMWESMSETSSYDLFKVQFSNTRVSGWKWFDDLHSSQTLCGISDIRNYALSLIDEVILPTIGICCTTLEVHSDQNFNFVSCSKRSDTNDDTKKNQENSRHLIAALDEAIDVLRVKTTSM